MFFLEEAVHNISKNLCKIYLRITYNFIQTIFENNMYNFIQTIF